MSRATQLEIYLLNSHFECLLGAADGVLFVITFADDLGMRLGAAFVGAIILLGEAPTVLDDALSERLRFSAHATDAPPELAESTSSPCAMRRASPTSLDVSALAAGWASACGGEVGGSRVPSIESPAA